VRRLPHVSGDRRFEVNDKDTAALAVFERGADGWTGVTLFHPGTVKYLNKRPQGVLLYRRPPP